MDEDLRAEVAELRARVEGTEAVLAIQRLKARYAELVDSRFVGGAVADGATLARVTDAAAELFTEDGVWDGGPALGRAEGRAEIAGRLQRPTLTFARHFFVAPTIEVDGDRATGRWQLLSPCIGRDGEAFWMSGWEDDEYARDADGVWRHTRMTMTPVFTAPNPAGWGRIFT